MADQVEMQDIRGIDIDKAVKGFALTEYVFKSVCQISSTSADHVRWYTETAADLTATSPAVVKNISPLGTFPELGPTWTRHTDYIQKYGAQALISMEDIKSADIDVLARTLLRLTRAVIKQVDTKIYETLTDNIASTSGISTTSANGINVIHTISGAWTNTFADPVRDIMRAKREIWTYDYNPEGATLFMSPTAHEYLLRWLISYKGSSIPQYASKQIEKGVVMGLLGANVRVSNNCTGTASGAAVLVIPQQACTWKSFADTTARAIEEPGIGTRVRVWEEGIPYLTDPRAVCLIKGMNNA